ncbi:hypothetical protein VNO80_29841 [Phaseolus coccineus]|uniref:Uncharacterized protein n=1 Tax=Phaseolus coccineus TaxID=3886 RepID=A0AAN9QCU5_PHACN
MLSLRKRTVENRNSRGAVVRKEEVVTLTRKLHGSTKAKGEKLHGSTKAKGEKLHGSTKAKGEKLHGSKKAKGEKLYGSTKAKGEKLYGSTKAKGEKLQRPPSNNHLQPIKLPLPPPPTTPTFRESMYHPVMKGYGMFSGQTNNQDFVQFESSKRQEERALLSTFMANAKANVTKYSDAEGSDAEGSDAKESEADNIISSEESEAESEAEDTNSEEFEAEDMSSEESEAENSISSEESEAESEVESEAENTNSEESDEAEDSDDEPPRRQVDIHRAMRTLSMQRQERRNYAYW